LALLRCWHGRRESLPRGGALPAGWGRLRTNAPDDARRRVGGLSGSLSFLSAIGQSGRRLLLSEYFVLVLTRCTSSPCCQFLPGLANPANLSNTLSNVWPLYAVAIGQTFVLAIGGIDLSQGAVVGLTSVVGAMLLATVAPGRSAFRAARSGASSSTRTAACSPRPITRSRWRWPAMLLVAVLIGAFNGASVAWLRMPPFMVTLVTMIAIGAFAIYITHSENIRNLPESYIALGKGDLVSVYIGSMDEPRIPRRQIYPLVTYPLLISVSLAIAAHFLLSRTVFGRQVYAIGTNRKAAPFPASRSPGSSCWCSSSRRLRDDRRAALLGPAGSGPPHLGRRHLPA
jgi:ribose/xylose/arabinose/galactoside ABC-type transport system permease subunit